MKICLIKTCHRINEFGLISCGSLAHQHGRAPGIVDEIFHTGPKLGKDLSTQKIVWLWPGGPDAPSRPVAL